MTKKLFIALALLAALIVPRAALGQTYVRPSKGSPYTVATNMALDGSTTKTSNVIDWSAFAGAEIEIVTTNSVSGLAATKCTYFPIVDTFGAATSTGIVSGVSGNEPNSLHYDTTGTSMDTYFVRIPTTYVEFYVSSMQAPASGYVTTCKVTVRVIPVPFDQRDSPAQTMALSTQASVTTSDTLVAGTTAATAGAHHTMVQSFCVGVVECGYGNNVNPNAAGFVVNYSFLLSTSGTANDGTGGSATLDDYVGILYCKSISGANPCTVGVTIW